MIGGTMSRRALCACLAACASLAAIAMLLDYLVVVGAFAWAGPRLLSPMLLAESAAIALLYWVIWRTPWIPSGGKVPLFLLMGVLVACAALADIALNVHVYGAGVLADATGDLVLFGAALSSPAFCLALLSWRRSGARPSPA